MKVASQTFMMLLGMVVFWMALHSSGQAAVLTHGPMIGHTTDTTTRIWVRADGPCKMQVHVVSKATTIVSETIRLVEENNFCGSAEVTGLSPRTTYRYRVLLDNKEQPCPVRQEITTFPRARQPGVIRIGFGHSLRGTGAQTIWSAIGAKKPDLFILILLGGDQHACKIALRPKESWGGYDLHEWMAGQLWNSKKDREKGYFRAFGLITVNTKEKPATARLEFFDLSGQPHQGRQERVIL